jgi:hypothetical protein
MFVGKVIVASFILHLSLVLNLVLALPEGKIYGGTVVIANSIPFMVCITTQKLFLINL